MSVKLFLPILFILSGCFSQSVSKTPTVDDILAQAKSAKLERGQKIQFEGTVSEITGSRMAALKAKDGKSGVAAGLASEKSIKVGDAVSLECEYYEITSSMDVYALTAYNCKKI